MQKQKQRVEESVDELIVWKTVAEDDIHGILVIGNADRDAYKLPASYNRAMGQWFQRFSHNGI